MNINSLQSITLAVAEARSVQPILRQIVQGVAEASDVALVRLWLLEADNQCSHCADSVLSKDEVPALHLVASAGKSRMSGRDYTALDGRSHRIKLGERKIGRIAQSGEPLLIAEVTPNQPWVADPEWIANEGVRSFAGQPLVCRSGVLGVLAVFSRTKFTDEDFQWLRIFAAHAAVAIWNARAFDELNRLGRRLALENEYLSEQEAAHFGEIIGKSRAMEETLRQTELVAGTGTSVLILGETGTGKELIARALHDRSPRRNRPWIKVNCGAVPRELFESEFFGHVKGAFTGAIKDRVGRFELADGGDLFLDEVGEIPLFLQSKLLRVLQEKQFERVGDTRGRSVDVRIIAATNRDLKKEAELGRFREDLYYRLSVFPIQILPLRKRREDIAPLAIHFAAKSAARMKIEPIPLSRAELEQLQTYDWPGNVRELENVIERATILSMKSRRWHFDLPKSGASAQKDRAQGAKETTAEIEPNPILTKNELKKRERANLLAALRKSDGRIFGQNGAAQLLGMRPTTLASRLKALGVRKTFTAPDQE